MKGKKTGGRQKGTVNHRTEEEVQSSRDLAAPHVIRAMERLVEHMECDSPPVSMTACAHILDRGLGKAIQAVESKTLIAVVNADPIEIARKAAFLLDNAQRVEDDKVITVQDAAQSAPVNDLH